MKLDPETGRWTVQLINGEQKSVKADNLECSPDIDMEQGMAMIKFMKENPAAAEKIGEEKHKDRRPLGENTTWTKVKGVHPGAVIRIYGLAKAAHLNGRKGRCLTFDPETGRWTVDLGDEQKSLKAENLIPAPKEKPPTYESATEEKLQQARDAEVRAGKTAAQVHAEDYGWEG